MQDLAAERGRMGRINLLVATPGRLLQHMDETPQFETNNLRVLGTRALCLDGVGPPRPTRGPLCRIGWVFAIGGLQCWTRRTASWTSGLRKR